MISVSGKGSPPTLSHKTRQGWDTRRYVSSHLARQFADPVYFPGLAAVGGEGLFHAGGRGREVEPDVAHENGAAFEVFLMEKFAAGGGEMADHGRRGESSVVEVDQVDAPLTRGGVVEAEGLRLDAESFVGGDDIELFEVGVAVEEFLVVGDAVVLDPDAGVVEAVGETADVSFPVADEEVEVVRAITLGKVCGIRSGLSVSWEGCSEDEKE